MQWSSEYNFFLAIKNILNTQTGIYYFFLLLQAFLREDEVLQVDPAPPERGRGAKFPGENVKQILRFVLTLCALDISRIISRPLRFRMDLTRIRNADFNSPNGLLSQRSANKIQTTKKFTEVFITHNCISLYQIVCLLFHK